MSNLSGNKGEWSEVYVLLKLLSEGRLNVADENLQPLNNIFFPIIEIFRRERNREMSFRLNGDIVLIDSLTDEEITRLSVNDFIHWSQVLFARLNSDVHGSFVLNEVEEFLNSIQIYSLCESNQEKADIRIKLHDNRTGLTPQLGFSIKSLLGGNSTLFNPGNTTNFKYKLSNNSIGSEEIDNINSIETRPKIRNRIETLDRLGIQLNFESIGSEMFRQNLVLIDSKMPEILGFLVLLRYSRSIDRVSELVNLLQEINPLEYSSEFGHPFYESKVKNFLTDAALGMTPSKLWTGEYMATGGIIFVREDGEVLCYHIYNKNEFQEYLYNNTKLEQASTSRYDFGNIYREGNDIFMNLNLQIRFI